MLKLVTAVLPGLVPGGVLLALLPRREAAARIAVYLLLFFLVRDAMTPVGLWALGATPALWIRFPMPGLLPLLGLASLGIVAALRFLEPELDRLVVYRKGSLAAGLGLGLLGAAAIAAPALAVNGWPGGKSAGLLFFCLAGNLYEEFLFRGWVQGYAEKAIGPARAGIVSALAFGFGHSLLAGAVTSVGWPLVLFTCYEGLLCAALRRRHGIWASTIAHGGGIFLIAG